MKPVLFNANSHLQAFSNSLSADNTPATKAAPFTESTPTETVIQIIENTQSPAPSAHQFVKFLELNQKLRKVAQDLLRRDPALQGQFVDQALCAIVDKHYKTLLDAPSEGVPSRPSEKLLNSAKIFLKDKQYVRMGFCDLTPSAHQTTKDRHPPSYWPSKKIRPAEILPLLEQLVEKTDLKELAVSLGHHDEPFSYETYNLPEGGRYDGNCIVEAKDNVEAIFSKLTQVRHNNPECDVSLSIGINSLNIVRAGELGIDMRFFDENRSRLESNLLGALEVGSGITTLNVVTSDKHFVPRLASVLKDDSPIRTLRFHLFSEYMPSEVSDSLCNVMANRKTPLALDCFIQAGFQAYRRNDGNAMKNMMVSFGKSQHMESLRLEVHHFTAHYLFAALNQYREFKAITKADDAESTIFDQQRATAKRQSIGELLKNGLTDLVSQEKLPIQFKVNPIEIRSDRTKEKTGPAPLDFEIIFTKEQGAKEITD